MISAILADDEVLARQKLRQLLRDEQDIEIVGECASASETIQLVGATNPELLFLDIRMPDMDGFDVLGALAVRQDLAMPQVVFTTAYDQYAVRAFEIHAIDYLLKPFTSERLHSAVQRVRERIEGHPQAATMSPPKRPALPTPLALSSNPGAVFSFCRSAIFAGSRPKKTMCAFAPEQNRICSAKPWLGLKDGSIRRCF
jgi:DNA-binding LytR/AlgR family response regulator